MWGNPDEAPRRVHATDAGRANAPRKRAAVASFQLASWTFRRVALPR
jgi:hypothetical protein